MSLDRSEGTIFKALGNAHRRAILDLLSGGPRTTKDLSAEMAGLSRFAVMQHLGVLEDAGLVTVRRRGRERLNHLNAVPIREVYERWVSRLAGESARDVLALKRFVEQEEQEGEQMTARSITIENEIRLKAPVARVWKAMTSEQDRWYPHSYGGQRLKRIVCEERVGGRVYEDWGDGSGHMYGHVIHWDPPSAIGYRSFLKPAIDLEQWAELEEDGDETILRHSTTAFGDISDEMAAAIKSHGDITAVEEQLRAWVERSEAVR